MMGRIHSIQQTFHMGVYYAFFLLWHNSPMRARAASFLRFLDHTQWHTTVGRTPLDEGSTGRRDLYRTTLKTDIRSCLWLHSNLQSQPAAIPVAKRSKARVYGRSFAGIAVSYPSGRMDVMSLLSAACCQVEVSATGWSVVQRSPTDCGV